MKQIIVLFLSISLFMACNSSKKVIVSPSSNDETSVNPPSSSGISFEENKSITLSSILERAKTEKKLVFLDAYASWCAPCKLMDKEVFPNSATGIYFSKNFISYKLNVEKNNGPTVKLLYDVTTLPTLLFLDADGNVLERANNSITISELNRLAKSAVAKAK
jgi:thiol:disulfide interchange protein